MWSETNILFINESYFHNTLSDFTALWIQPLLILLCACVTEFSLFYTITTLHLLCVTSVSLAYRLTSKHLDLSNAFSKNSHILTFVFSLKLVYYSVVMTCFLLLTDAYGPSAIRLRINKLSLGLVGVFKGHNRNYRRHFPIALFSICFELVTRTCVLATKTMGKWGGAFCIKIYRLRSDHPSSLHA